MWFPESLIMEHGRELGMIGIAVYDAIAVLNETEAERGYGKGASVQEIASMLGCSPRRVRHALWNLEDLDYIHSTGLESEVCRETIEEIRYELLRSHRWYMVALVARDGTVCARCGRAEDVTIDHVVPVSRGGNNHLSNLQLLCRSCNSKKGASVGWYVNNPGPQDER